jgi:hypothetical protein
MPANLPRRVPHFGLLAPRGDLMEIGIKPCGTLMVM